LIRRDSPRQQLRAADHFSACGAPQPLVLCTGKVNFIRLSAVLTSWFVQLRTDPVNDVVETAFVSQSRHEHLNSFGSSARQCCRHACGRLGSSANFDPVLFFHSLDFLSTLFKNIVAIRRILGFLPFRSARACSSICSGFSGEHKLGRPVFFPAEQMVNRVWSGSDF